MIDGPHPSTHPPGIHPPHQVFPASTDARFVRAAKIPAFGFSPMRSVRRRSSAMDVHTPTLT